MGSVDMLTLLQRKKGEGGVYDSNLGILKYFTEVICLTVIHVISGLDLLGSSKMSGCDYAYRQVFLSLFKTQSLLFRKCN